MFHYAFLTAPKEPPITASMVDAAIKPICPKAQASTVATHTNPWIIIVHCSEELTDQERTLIGQAIEGI